MKLKPKEGKIKEEAFVNPSYDKSLSLEKRLYDFLGKYYINLNGVVPNNNPEITEPHKKEVVDFVCEIFDQKLKETKRNERIKMLKMFQKLAHNHKIIF